MLDDYYKDQAEMTMEERLKVNYDHPKAFDFPLMRKHLKDLKEGRSIEKPTYDFVAHTRAEKIEVVIPKKIILVEGIMALVDKTIRELGDIKVFITASSERRFLRRIIRDTNERGRTLEGVVRQYFSSVQPMYGEIVEPSSIYADIIINNDGVKNLAIDVLTSLVYEELERVENLEPVTQKDEFDEESLAKAFHHKNQ